MSAICLLVFMISFVQYPPVSDCSITSVRVTSKILLSHLLDRPDTADFSGSAVAEIQVDESGRVCFVSLVSADPGIARPALESLHRWRFSPFLLAGYPIQVTAMIPVRFGGDRRGLRSSDQQLADLCSDGSVCLYLKADGTLAKEVETENLHASKRMNRHVLLRPDAQAPFAVVEEAYTLLRRNSPFPVRLFAPYFAEGARVVRLPGEFVDRNWLVGAARGLGYAVMRVEAWVEFEQTSVKAPWGTFTVNLKNDNDGGRRMRRLLYQGPPGTPPRPWPEEWTYEFEVDHDGLVSLILPPDGRLSPLDRAVMKLSKRVSPAPHPAPASVFLKLKLAR